MICETVKRALQMLDFNEIPKMNELRSKFLRKCLELHPDKGGSTERFQELLDAKDIISRYIEKFWSEHAHEAVPGITVHITDIIMPKHKDTIY